MQYAEIDYVPPTAKPNILLILVCYQEMQSGILITGN